MAAPIRDYTEKVIAGVSISSPTYHVGPGQINKFVEILQEAAKEVSSKLGEGILR